jgi:hypothetical protein
MADATLPAEIAPTERRLTAAEFQGLAEVPPEIEWFNNITNPGTKRIYKIAGLADASRLAAAVAGVGGFPMILGWRRGERRGSRNRTAEGRNGLGGVGVGSMVIITGLAAGSGDSRRRSVRWPVLQCGQWRGDGANLACDLTGLDRERQARKLPGPKLTASGGHHVRLFRRRT